LESFFGVIGAYTSEARATGWDPVKFFVETATWYIYAMQHNFDWCWNIPPIRSCRDTASIAQPFFQV
jgi:hypothetical protein